MFTKILKNLMEDKGLNQRQLSIQAGIPLTTINGWFKAKRLPDYYSIKKLATFFNVTSDYLLELEDEWGNKSIHISNSFNNVSNSNIKVGK